MATVNYTSLLGLALPTTGDLSGQWGNEVNNFITQYLDSSVAGTQVISGSQTAVTLTPTQGASLVQALGTTAGSSQYAIINCTGSPASTLTITVSYASLTNAQFSKSYLVINATSPSQSVVVRATTSSGTSSGVTLVSGEKAVVAWNGSDFVKVSSTVALPAGSTTQVQYNNAGALAGSSNLTFDGTTLTTTTTSGIPLVVTGTGNVGARIVGGTGAGLGSYLSLQAQGGNAALIGTEASITGSGTSTNLMLYGYGSNSIIFAPATAEGMRLTSTGLGIGTSSPSTRLHAAIASGTAYTTSSTGNVLTLSNSTASGYAGIAFNTEPSAGNAGIAAINSFAPASGDAVLTFSTRSSATLAERMRLDASGNLGLGVTPSAWSGIFKVIDFSTTASLAGSSGGANLFNNAYYNGTDYIYKTTAAATRYLQSSGAHTWYNAASGTAGNTISFTQAMTLDASGNLGVGVTSPVAKFDLAGDYREGVVTANTGTTYTISTATGTLQILTLTGNCTFTFPTATAGESFTLILKQDGTGGRTVTWPAAVKWPGGTAPTITSTASRSDKYIFTADGTNWIGSTAGQNYTL